jgi:hypothetical protein
MRMPRSTIDVELCPDQQERDFTIEQAHLKAMNQNMSTACYHHFVVRS